MNNLLGNILKSFRKLYSLANPETCVTGRNWRMFSSKDYANDLIYDYLMNDEPCMIARFGSNELSCLVNYIGVKQNHDNWLNFIQCKSLQWWWNQHIINQMKVFAGFFSTEEGNIERFCELMIKEIPNVDILGSWLLEEKYFSIELNKAKRVVLEDLEPFFSIRPWTRALKGKKVLVVHPFAETIEQQYAKRHLLFDTEILPDFELKTIKEVQSIADTDTNFQDWFEALAYMIDQIDSIDYDICIIGCGAYGFPLASHVKRMGKKSIHLAGVTQLLFGIKGKRWEQFIVWPYMNLFNEHWVRPGDKETPINSNVVENACYW